MKCRWYHRPVLRLACLLLACGGIPALAGEGEIHVGLGHAWLPLYEGVQSVALSADGGADICARGDAFHVLDPTVDTIRGDKNGARLVVVEAAEEPASMVQ